MLRACERMFVTENRINFLTLPECLSSPAIFGGGHAIERLGSRPMLREKPLDWGDIDTHGFAILSRLRQHWEHTRSLLTDPDRCWAIGHCGANSRRSAAACTTSMRSTATSAPSTMICAATGSASACGWSRSASPTHTCWTP
jgi:hypothetical protein